MKKYLTKNILQQKNNFIPKKYTKLKWIFFCLMYEFTGILWNVDVMKTEERETFI